MEHRTLAGVIFDLDGTLLDSTAVWSQIDRIILQEHGIQPPAHCRSSRMRWSC